jgi:hypothetical protein
MEAFGKNDRVLYIKGGEQRPCVIKEVHRDDAPNWYYTVNFDDGSEKQTVEKYLEQPQQQQQNQHQRQDESKSGVNNNIPAINLNDLRITIWDAAKIKKLNTRGQEHFTADLDSLGRMSGISQNLSGPITTVSKLIKNPDHIIITINNNSNEMIGYLKYGYKDLFFYNKKGKILEFNGCICLLDFYINNIIQRNGCGLLLFNTFLNHISQSYINTTAGKLTNGENFGPHVIAYDRPSPKLLSFMKKHFHLSKPDLQPNRYTIFEGFPLPK